jgi:cell division protein FtsB
MPAATPSSRSSADAGTLMRARAFWPVLALLLVLLAWLQYRLWFGSGGEREVEALRQQVHQQARDNTGLKQRNEALAAEVEDLKSGEAAVEERARSELGMIKPGETFYRVVEPQPQPAPPDESDKDESR